MTVYPRIQKIIIVKKYNDVRIDEALQKAIMVFMESFPITNFWEYVIVVISWADSRSEIFKDFMENDFQSFRNKINKCENLLQYMKEKKIEFPNEIKEYFIESRYYKKFIEMNETLNAIKLDILNSEKMFFKIEKSDIITKTEESKENKGFFIITKFYKITFTDFNGTKIETERIFSIHEESPSEANLIETKKIEKFIKYDDIRWYDVLSLSATWWIRDTKIYRVYIQKIYKIGDKIIKGDEIYETTIWK